MVESNKRTIIILGMVLIAIIVTLVGTFAYFISQTQSEPERLTVTTGTLALTFSDNNLGITASSLSLGESTTKEFMIENTGTEDVTTNMLWDNLVNTYLKQSMSYIFQYKTSEEGEWEMTPLASGNIPRSGTPQDFNLAENITIPAGSTYYYKLTITFNNLSDVDQTTDINAILTSNFKLGDTVTLTDVDKTLLALGKLKKEGTPNFSTTAVTDETLDGLYSMADDYGTSYYYRGAVTNNYVKFANKYWRIIRVNGDGSLRMIYDGTVAHKNGEGNATFTTTGVDGSTQSIDRFTHIEKVFNTSSDDNAHEGWMYGSTLQSGTDAYERTHANTNNSTLKTLVNEWYDTNLTSYDEYIADAVYCNDRSMPGQSVTGIIWDTGLGYGTNATAYGVFGRLIDFETIGAMEPSLPQFVCPQKNDAYTVGDGVHGNAIGTTKSRKIGLITMDEVVAAGGIFSTQNKDYYLYKSSDYSYWTMSPLGFNINANMVIVFTSGLLFSEGVDTIDAVAPVISIKAEYARTMTGSGAAGSPYQIPDVG